MLVLLFVVLLVGTFCEFTTPGQNEKLLNDIREVIKKSVENEWELYRVGLEVDRFVTIDEMTDPKIMLGHWMNMAKKIDDLKEFTKEYCFQQLSDNRDYKRPPFVLKDILICEKYVRTDYVKYDLMKCMYQRRVDILQKFINENKIKRAKEFLGLIPSTFSPVHFRAFSYDEGEGFVFLEGASEVELTVDCVIDEREVMFSVRNLERDDPSEDPSQTAEKKETRLNAQNMLDQKESETPSQEENETIEDEL